MKIKLNSDMNGHKKGDVVEICDNEELPSDLFWRKRLKDSLIDNCIEIVTESSHSGLKQIKKEIKKPETPVEKKEVSKNDCN